MNPDMETCSHNSDAPISILENLPYSQAGAGRHKCPVCAYNAGLRKGIEEELRRAEQALFNISPTP
jgi:hypothetical protein